MTNTSSPSMSPWQVRLSKHNSHPQTPEGVYNAAMTRSHDAIGRILRRRQDGHELVSNSSRIGSRSGLGGSLSWLLGSFTHPTAVEQTQSREPVASNRADVLRAQGALGSMMMNAARPAQVSTATTNPLLRQEVPKTPETVSFYVDDDGTVAWVTRKSGATGDSYQVNTYRLGVDPVDPMIGVTRSIHERDKNGGLKDPTHVEQGMIRLCELDALADWLYELDKRELDKRESDHAQSDDPAGSGFVIAA